ncbi:hypothetical protein M0R45_030794 [Rubus argutus]|uniref:Uncharacterized protein n=1 Tax=Rubus argutus TaxID=59490 RepID=A0AAW1WBP5_RUBAR
MQYVTRTSALEYEDFNSAKSRLIEQAEKFGEISTKARRIIAVLSQDFIFDGCTILVHGFSRVIFEVLKTAAQSKKLFRVVCTGYFRFFRYLIEHPEYIVDGLCMSQFSFQIPRPLQENYVRKRPAAPCLIAAAYSGRSLEPTEANPIAWAGPDDTDLRLGSPYLEAHVFDPVGRPTKKRAKTRTPSRVYNSSNLNISTESRLKGLCQSGKLVAIPQETKRADEFGLQRRRAAAVWALQGGSDAADELGK